MLKNMENCKMFRVGVNREHLKVPSSSLSLVQFKHDVKVSEQKVDIERNMENSGK